MGTKAQKPPPTSHANGDLLDTWKEIASYLNRDVRTAQRMEREGLPVYRHPTKKRANVYAYRSEIDVWWAETQGRASTRPETGADEKDTPAPDRKLRWLVILAAALGIVALSIWWLRTWPPANTEFHQTLESTLRFDAAVVSPSGKSLAYADSETAHLHVRDLESGDDRVLVPEWTGGAYVWSPDSSMLAYPVFESPRRVEIVDVRTADRRVLLEKPENEPLFRPHSWTPDGRHLLGRLVGPRREAIAALIDVDSGDLTAIAVPAKDVARLTISPDGRFVTYRSKRDGNSDIYLWPLSGEGEERRLTEFPDFEHSEIWSPDGRYLFFIRRQPRGESSLWVLELTDSGERVAEPYRVLPAGDVSMKLIPSMGDSGDIYLGRKEGSGTQVFVLDLDPVTGEAKGEPQSLFPVGSSSIGWSSDGSRLRYRNWSTNTRQAGKVSYFERDLESGAERVELIPMPPGHDVYDHTWPTEDNRSYLFGVRHPKEVLRYDIDTKEITTVIQFDEPVNSFGETPRKEYLSVLTEPENRNEFNLELVQLPDGQRRRLLTSRTQPWADWSPDGRELAYADASCLMVVPWEGGAPHELACASPSKLPQKGGYQPQSAGYLWNGQNPSWSPDGTKIAWTVPVPETKRVEMWVVDRATGEYSVAWTGGEDYVTMPRAVLWSPAGDRIAFDMWRYAKTQVWALRNLLTPDAEGKSAVSRVAVN